MSTVYVSFEAPIVPASLEQLINAVASQIAEKATEVHLLLSSVGGDPAAALSAYNILRGLPVNLVTHNVGRIGSAANTLFLAGGTRYASPRSDFHVHRVIYDFTEDVKADINQIKEHLQIMLSDHRGAVGVIADRTRLTPTEIERMMGEGVLMDADAALAAGIINEIREFRLPPGAAFVQMAFRRPLGR